MKQTGLPQTSHIPKRNLKLLLIVFISPFARTHQTLRTRLLSEKIETVYHRNL